MVDPMVLRAKRWVPKSARDYYGDGAWTHEDFAGKHILFFDDAGYVGKIFG